MTVPKLAIHVFCSICCCCFFCHLQSQNLFANAGFEDINRCVEYHADCAPEAWFNIPATNILVNSRVAPRPVLGHMVLTVPIGNVMTNFNKPRYVYSGFCCPLVAGQKYSLSFFINTPKLPFQSLAFYFTAKEPTLGNVAQLIAAPSLIISAENIDADYKDNWKHVRADYSATGEEKFCIITTEGLPARNFDMKDAMNSSGDVLCFIDEILFKAANDLPVCENYNAIQLRLYEQDYRHTDDMIALPESKPTVHFTNDTITIAALLFDVGKYDLKSNVKNKLDSLISVLAKKKFLKIEVSGHTDNSGNQQNNQVLSENRARAIQQYIITALPKFAEKIQSTGKGQNFPVAGNDTEAGRERNRRVEIVITYFDVVK
jgi:outer membrane protein OmpA-like peptidoglycan-associated protein